MLPVRTVSHQNTEEEVEEAVEVVVVIIGTDSGGQEEASPFSISVQQKRTQGGYRYLYMFQVVWW